MTPSLAGDPELDPDGARPVRVTLNFFGFGHVGIQCTGSGAPTLPLNVNRGLFAGYPIDADAFIDNNAPIVWQDVPGGFPSAQMTARVGPAMYLAFLRLWTAHSASGTYFYRPLLTNSASSFITNEPGFPPAKYHMFLDNCVVATALSLQTLGLWPRPRRTPPEMSRLLTTRFTWGEIKNYTPPASGGETDPYRSALGAMAWYAQQPQFAQFFPPNPQPLTPVDLLDPWKLIARVRASGMFVAGA